MIGAQNDLCYGNHVYCNLRLLQALLFVFADAHKCAKAINCKGSMQKFMIFDHYKNVKFFASWVMFCAAQ